MAKWSKASALLSSNLNLDLELILFILLVTLEDFGSFQREGSLSIASGQLINQESRCSHGRSRSVSCGDHVDFHYIPLVQRCLKFSKVLVGWEKAKSECKKDNAILAVLKSDEIHKAFATARPEKKEYWIGYNRRQKFLAVTDRFIWNDDANPPDDPYEDWENRPFPSGRRDVCVLMNKEDAAHWRAKYCTYKTRFVCELVLGSQERKPLSLTKSLRGTYTYEYGEEVVLTCDMPLPEGKTITLRWSVVSGRNYSWSFPRHRYRSIFVYKHVAKKTTEERHEYVDGRCTRTVALKVTLVVTSELKQAQPHCCVDERCTTFPKIGTRVGFGLKAVASIKPAYGPGINMPSNRSGLYNCLAKLGSEVDMSLHVFWFPRKMLHSWQKLIRIGDTPANFSDKPEWMTDVYYETGYAEEHSGNYVNLTIEFDTIPEWERGSIQCYSKNTSARYVDIRRVVFAEFRKIHIFELPKKPVIKIELPGTARAGRVGAGEVIQAFCDAVTGSDRGGIELHLNTWNASYQWWKFEHRSRLGLPKWVVVDFYYTTELGLSNICARLGLSITAREELHGATLVCRACNDFVCLENSYSSFMYRFISGPPTAVFGQGDGVFWGNCTAKVGEDHTLSWGFLDHLGKETVWRVSLHGNITSDSETKATNAEVKFVAGYIDEVQGSSITSTITVSPLPENEATVSCYSYDRNSHTASLYGRNNSVSRKIQPDKSDDLEALVKNEQFQIIAILVLLILILACAICSCRKSRRD